MLMEKVLGPSSLDIGGTGSREGGGWGGGGKEVRRYYKWRNGRTVLT